MEGEKLMDLRVGRFHLPHIFGPADGFAHSLIPSAANFLT